MTLEVALNLLATLPGRPAWNNDIAELYSLHLVDWHPETRRRTLVEATATCTLRPTVAELREIALRLTAPLPGLGTLREELRRVITYYPPAERALHADPLLNLLADELGGWREIGSMGTEELEKRFPSACDRARREFLAQNAQELLTHEPVALLGSGGKPKPKEISS